MEQRRFRHLVASFLTLAMLLTSTALPVTVQSGTKQVFLPLIRSSSIALAVYSTTPAAPQTARIDVVSPQGSAISGTDIDLVCGDPLRWAPHKPMFACPIRTYVDGHFHYLGGRVGKADGTVVGVDGGYWDVAWSADGTQVVFGGIALELMREDGSGRATLDDQPSLAPIWSPTGSRIAYLSASSGRLMVLPLGGGPAVAVGPVPVGAYAWSPDGTHLAVRGLENSSFRLVIIDLATLVETQSAEDVISFAWSPDGTRLAFDTGPGRDLYVVGLDGTHLTHLGVGIGLRWSPDGRRLALLHYDTDIEVVTLATGERRKLPWGYAEVWSPDGQAMAMVTDINGAVVTIAPLDDRAPVQIAGLHSAGELSWSPDSTWLGVLSVSADGRGPQLLSVSRDGRRVVELMSGVNSYSWVW